MPVPSTQIATGSAAPDFTLRTATGEEISLSDYRGRRCLVLVFLRGLF